MKCSWPKRFVILFKIILLFCCCWIFFYGKFDSVQIDLGNRLMPAFNSASGIPYSDVNLRTRIAHAPEWGPDSSTSEVTTLQLEFRDLSKCTADSKYEEVTQSVIIWCERENNPFKFHALGYRENQWKGSWIGKDVRTRPHIHQCQHREIPRLCNNLTWIARRFVLWISV